MIGRGETDGEREGVLEGFKERGGDRRNKGGQGRLTKF